MAAQSTAKSRSLTEGVVAPKPKRPRRAGTARGVTNARESLLPALGTFLELDDNEATIGSELVDAYVRCFLKCDNEEAERRAVCLVS